MVMTDTISPCGDGGVKITWKEPTKGRREDTVKLLGTGMQMSRKGSNIQQICCNPDDRGMNVSKKKMMIMIKTLPCSPNFWHSDLIGGI